jgi:hypothetical protein
MIAAVLPSIRPEMVNAFKEAWKPIFEKHNVELVVVYDGDEPKLVHGDNEFSVNDVMGEYSDVIFNKNDGIRNLGFAYVAKTLPDVKYVFTTDDDCFPVGDTIEDHLNILGKDVSVSWISTASEYMRGFPYGIRSEARVVLSHGVWDGIKDYDAATQLVNGNKDASFYRGPIPKGIYFPMCIMNVMFDVLLLPWMYQFPMGPSVGLDRFADIWSGIEVKRAIDQNCLAAVTGYSRVYHKRASNIFVNLQKEAKGIQLNETFWNGDESNDYFKLYREKEKRWKEFFL